MVKNQEIIDKVRQLVSLNKLDDALRVVLDFCANEPSANELLNEATHIQGRLTSFKKSDHDGVLSAEEKLRVENNLRISILNLIPKIEKGKPIEHSKLETITNPEGTRKLYFGNKLIYILMPLLFGLVYWVFQYKSERDYNAQQKDLIIDSNLIVYVSSKAKWDTLRKPTVLQDITDFQLSDTCLVIEFSFEEKKFGVVDSMKFYLNQGFMDDYNWPSYVKQWDKEYPGNGHTYKPIPPLQREKYYFKANFVKN